MLMVQGGCAIDGGWPTELPCGASPDGHPAPRRTRGPAAPPPCKSTGLKCKSRVTRELAKYRTVIDRNRHRARKAKCASTFSRADHAERIYDPVALGWEKQLPFPPSA